MPEGPNIRVQEFQWHLLDEFSDLLNGLGRHGFRSWPESPEELRSELETLRLDPESGIGLVRNDGALCGYALTLSESDIDRVVVSIGLRPDCSGQSLNLLQFVVDRAQSANASRIHVAIRGSDSEPVDQLVESGFKVVTANLELTLHRNDAAGVTDVPVTAGFSFRPMRSSAETLLLTQVQNRVFEDHWGYSKNGPSEIQSRLDLPSTGPEHVLFIEAPEGGIAGYVWTALEWHRDHTCGKIWMTGVMPEFRGKGLGSALVHAGIKHLLAEGAADVHLEVVENNAAAVRIYERLGFKKYGKTTWYEKRI